MQIHMYWENCHSDTEMWSNYLIFGITWLTFYPIKCIDIHVRHILYKLSSIIL
jgi:hypothetical protein